MDEFFIDGRGTDPRPDCKVLRIMTNQVEIPFK